jgi:hypothetical protein
MTDDSARLTHLLDQVGGHLHQFTPVMKAYFRELTTGDNPIPPEQAIQLVRDAQARLWGRPGGEP